MPNHWITSSASIATLKHLRKGMERWKAKGATSNWPDDFHNCFYCTQRERMHSRAFTGNWWKCEVDDLSRWKAIRPHPKERILKRGRSRLAQLHSAFDKLMKATHNGTVQFDRVKWGSAQPLFEVAQSIKNVSSPVFASKLCHFCVPQYYPPYDRDFVRGKVAYEEYWAACQLHWHKCTCRRKLRSVLTAQLEDCSPSFPFATKIVELCIAGWVAYNGL